MDQRIESFLGDVLALAGEEPEAVPEGVRRALAKGETTSGCRNRTARLPLDSTSAAKLPQRRVRVRVAHKPKTAACRNGGSVS